MGGRAHRADHQRGQAGAEEAPDDRGLSELAQVDREGRLVEEARGPHRDRDDEHREQQEREGTEEVGEGDGVRVLVHGSSRDKR